MQAICPRPSSSRERQVVAFEPAGVTRYGKRETLAGLGLRQAPGLSPKRGIL